MNKYNTSKSDYNLEILPIKSKDEIILKGYILTPDDGFDLTNVKIPDYIFGNISGRFDLDTIELLANISHSVKVISIDSKGIYVELHNLETPSGKIFTKILLDFIETFDDIPTVIAKPNAIGHIENDIFKVVKLLSITLDIKSKDSI